MADFSDFGALYALQLSQDPKERALATQAAAKLTPQEQQGYFDFQQQQTKGRGEKGRVDAGIGGVPAELAVAGPLIGGAMGMAGPLKRGAAGAALGGTEGFIRSGGDLKATARDAAVGGLAGVGFPTLKGYLKGTVGDLAEEAGKRFTQGRSAAAATPSIVKVSTPGLGQMFTREATGEAVQQAESAALRNQLLHQLSSQKGEITPGGAALAGGAAAGLLAGGKKVYDSLAVRADELKHKLNPFDRYNDVVNPPR
jgi:hypothetical protein